MASVKCVHIGEEKLCIAPAIEVPDDGAKSDYTIICYLINLYFTHTETLQLKTTSFQLQPKNI